MKGIALISAVIFIAITIVAVAIVYEAGVPVVKKVQAAASIERMKSIMSEIDSVVREVASEGAGSKRTLYFNLEPDELRTNSTTDRVVWTFDTDSPVISPRTEKVFGNMHVGSNLDMNVSEGNYTLTSPQIPAFILENAHLKAWFRKIGNSTSYANYSTSDIIIAIYQKDTGKWLIETGFVTITVNDDESTKTGSGFTSLDRAGYELPYGTVRAYMDLNYTTYNMTFTLESGADYLIIEGSA